MLLKMKLMKQSYMTMEYFYKLVETYILKKLWSNLKNWMEVMSFKWWQE